MQFFVSADVNVIDDSFLAELDESDKTSISLDLDP